MCIIDRGNLHAGRNELSKAIDDYSIAIRIDSNLAEAYYNRGIARAKTGNKQAGIQEISPRLESWDCMMLTP